MLNSHKIDDRCGLCNGNGTSCNIVNGTLEVDDEGEKIVLSSPRANKLPECIPDTRTTLM